MHVECVVDRSVIDKYYDARLYANSEFFNSLDAAANAVRPKLGSCALHPDVVKEVEKYHIRTPYARGIKIPEFDGFITGEHLPYRLVTKSVKP